MSNNHSSCAKDGGANSAKTTMPPVSQEYRNNYDSIFGKSKLEQKVENEQLGKEVLAEKEYKKGSLLNDIFQEIGQEEMKNFLDEMSLEMEKKMIDKSGNFIIKSKS